MANSSPLRKPTRSGVVRAAEKIARLLPPTPLLPVVIRGHRVWCKAENLQPIGAFKIRGAWHRLTDLSNDERRHGVVAVSSGNHAQGVAWAARELGIAATIVMPSDAPGVKLDGTRTLGANVVLYDRPGGESRDDVAARLVAESGATLVHAYGDPWVIEGQGSAGIELAAQLAEEPTRIVACCGGGGLAAGLALACPDSAIVPVEPEGWDDVRRSLAAGEILTVGPNPPPTACDALQTLATYPVNFEVLYGRAARRCRRERGRGSPSPALRLLPAPARARTRRRGSAGRGAERKGGSRWQNGDHAHRRKRRRRRLRQGHRRIAAVRKCRTALDCIGN